MLKEEINNGIGENGENKLNPVDTPTAENSHQDERDLNQGSHPNGSNGSRENSHRPFERSADLDSLVDFIGKVAAENKILPKIIQEAKRTVKFEGDSTATATVTETIAHFYSLEIARLLLTQPESYFCLRQPIFTDNPNLLGSMLLALSGRLRPENCHINTEMMIGTQAALLLKKDFGQILTRAYQRNLEAYDGLQVERAKPLSRAINNIALRGGRINEIFTSVIKDLEPTLMPEAKFGDLPPMWYQEQIYKAPQLRSIEFNPSELEKTAREIVAGMIKREVLADHPNPTAVDFYDAAVQAVLFAPESLFILKDILRNPSLPEEVRQSLREWIEGRLYSSSVIPEKILASRFGYQLQQCIDNVARIFALKHNFGADKVSELANTPKGIDNFGPSDFQLRKLVYRTENPSKILGLSLVSRRDRKQLRQIPRAQYFLLADELASVALERQDKALLDSRQLDDYLKVHDILDRLPRIATQYHLEREEIEQSAREAAQNLLAAGEIGELIGQTGEPMAKWGHFFDSVFKEVFNNAESPFSLKCMGEDYDRTRSCRQILEAYRQFLEQPSLAGGNGKFTPEQQIAMQVLVNAKQYMATLLKQLILQARFGVETEDELSDSRADRVKVETKNRLPRFLRKSLTPRQQFAEMWQPVAGYLAALPHS